MKRSGQKFTRRTLLELTPTVATLILSQSSPTNMGMAQSRQATTAPMRVFSDQIKTALEILDLEFTDAQVNMMAKREYCFGILSSASKY